MNTILYVQNLKCGGCANTITKNITAIKHISNVIIKVEESSVAFDSDTPETVELVKEKLKSLGYPEDGTANNLGSKAKSYVSCAIGKMN
jgi:copper chaperone CopZ